MHKKIIALTQAESEQVSPPLPYGLQIGSIAQLIAGTYAERIAPSPLFGGLWTRAGLASEGVGAVEFFATRSGGKNRLTWTTHQTPPTVVFAQFLDRDVTYHDLNVLLPPVRTRLELDQVIFDTLPVDARDPKLGGAVALMFAPPVFKALWRVVSETDNLVRTYPQARRSQVLFLETVSNGKIIGNHFGNPKGTETTHLHFCGEVENPRNGVFEDNIAGGHLTTEADLVDSARVVNVFEMVHETPLYYRRLLGYRAATDQADAKCGGE